MRSTIEKIKKYIFLVLSFVLSLSFFFDPTGNQPFWSVHDILIVDSRTIKNKNKKLIYQWFMKIVPYGARRTSGKWCYGVVVGLIWL